MSWISARGLSEILLHFEPCCSAHPLSECQTGLPDWDLKMKCQGSCYVNLKVCASPESPPAKYREHHTVALPPETMQSFWLINCFLCFRYIPLALENAWHRTLFSILRKLLLITFYLLIYVLQVNYLIYFLLFSGLPSPKKQHIPLFYLPKLLFFPKCLHIQTQAPSGQALPLHLLQSTGLCGRAAPTAVIQLGKHGPSR